MINTNHAATSDTPAASRRRPSRAAETLGFASPATKGADEGVYVELGVARIHLCKRQGLRWPELTETGPAAATGVRASAGSEFWCMAAPAGGRGHLLGANRVL